MACNVCYVWFLILLIVRFWYYCVCICTYCVYFSNAPCLYAVGFAWIYKWFVCILRNWDFSVYLNHKICWYSFERQIQIQIMIERKLYNWWHSHDSNTQQINDKYKIDSCEFDPFRAITLNNHNFKLNQTRLTTLWWHMTK